MSVVLTLIIKIVIILAKIIIVLYDVIKLIIS